MVHDFRIWLEAVKELNRRLGAYPTDKPSVGRGEVQYSSWSKHDAKAATLRLQIDARVDQSLGGLVVGRIPEGERPVLRPTF